MYGLGRPTDLAEATGLALKHEQGVHGGGATEQPVRFEVGGKYRPIGDSYLNQYVTVVAVNGEWAIGWWPNGDPWVMRHGLRAGWLECGEDEDE